MNPSAIKAAISARLQFGWSSFCSGFAALWAGLQVIALIGGGSVIAYVALALDSPAWALVFLLTAVLATVVEGSFRLHRVDVALREGAQEAASRFVQDAPQLSFGRAEIPAKSQPYELQWGDGERFTEHGRVIRVPVQNALGRQKATGVQARLVFQPKDIHSSFSPKHPITAEWDEPEGRVTEIEFQGNGSPRFLNVVFIRDRPYPHGFVWTQRSRASALSGFAIASDRIEIEVEVTAAGPTKPMLKDTLIVECRTRQLIRADWTSRNSDEEGNNIEGWDGEAM